MAKKKKLLSETLRDILRMNFIHLAFSYVGEDHKDDKSKQIDFFKSIWGNTIKEIAEYRGVDLQADAEELGEIFCTSVNLEEYEAIKKLLSIIHGKEDNLILDLNSLYMQYLGAFTDELFTKHADEVKSAEDLRKQFKERFTIRNHDMSRVQIQVDSEDDE